ncbi:MAG: alpha/beta hydrolase [Spirochaetales bacterium]|nr:alpha/beta hydrolase [Spirochaetales bacterium]
MKGKTALIPFVASLALVLLTGCFAMNEAKLRYAETMAVLDVDYNGEVIRDLRYGEQPRNLYDLYLPEDTSGEKAKHLILFIHGGSWTSGSKEDGQPFCRNFSAHGYTSASISYTLSDESNSPTILSINQEVRAAVMAIEAKCAELGIDLADMAVSGFSAGACQALMYGLNTAAAYDGLPVRFILQQSGPTSFEPSIWRSSDVHWSVRRQAGLDGSKSGDAAWISRFSGKSVTAAMVESGEADAIWREVSPFTYVTSTSVPVLSAYGVHDGIVPPVSRIILERALEEKGVPHDTIVLEHSGHALACDVDLQRQFLKLVYEYCEAHF